MCLRGYELLNKWEAWAAHIPYIAVEKYTLEPLKE